MSGRAELRQFRGARCRRSLWRHRADAELLDHPFPGGGVRAWIGEVGFVERERRAGRQRVAGVVAPHAVLAHHRLVTDVGTSGGVDWSVASDAVSAGAG